MAMALKPDVKPPNHPVTITVNNRVVNLPDHQLTGLAIKQAAITQGVPIDLDFLLYRMNPGGPLKQIGDQETVTLHDREALRATAADDNS